MVTLTSEQSDALTELVNIGIGQAAASLNSMVGHHIQLHVPKVYLIQRNTIKQNFHNDFHNLSSVIMQFSGTFEGSAALIFPKESAETLVAYLTDTSEDALDMDELKAGALTEVGNILINGVMGSISNMLQAMLHYSVPDYIEGNIDNLMNIGNQDGDSILIAETVFKINELNVKGTVALFFHVASFETLLQHLDKEISA
jgi:chemotaxis protein CheC